MLFTVTDIYYHVVQTTAGTGGEEKSDDIQREVEREEERKLKSIPGFYSPRF